LSAGSRSWSGGLGKSLGCLVATVLTLLGKIGR
jgi:hypothetical protein